MHTQRKHSWIFFVAGLLGLMLAGCAANVGKSITASNDQLAKYETFSATDAIAALDKRINEARNANMPFLAPNYYRGAHEILSDVQKAADKKPKNELIGEIAKADAILDKGNTMMVIVQDRLANLLTMKNQMDKDNVAKIYPKEYEKSVDALSGLIEKVELEKAGNTDKDNAELLKKMQALDVRTIQYTTLHASDVINEDTDSKDGDKQASATLAESIRVYQDALNRIALAPHDDAQVTRAGADALFAALHARYVNERVAALQIKLKESIEAVVLEEEKRLLDISTALNNQDLRDRPVEKQAEDIAKAAGEIVQGQQSSKQAIGAINDQSKALELRLKEAHDETQQAKLQIIEKDSQLKIANDRVLQLEEQNKALTAEKTQKPKTSKVPRKSTTK